MGIARRLAGLGVALASLAMTTSAGAAEDAACAPSAETAAVRFISLSWNDPAASVALIAPASLASYRGRLEQVLEDRYSPMSAALRRRVLGEDWTPERLHTASDVALVGAYLARGAPARAATLSSTPVVTSHVKQAFLGDVVTVSYEGGVGGEERKLEYPLVVNELQGCWKLDMPPLSWPNLNRLASLLRQSRAEALPGREGPSRARLDVVEASDEEQPAMIARSGPSAGRTTWTARMPLATEADVVGAEASWDCEEGQGPAGAAVGLRLGDDAGRRIAQWSGSHTGSQLAIVVDGTVLTRATVQSRLGSTFTVCVPDDGGGLERADQLARALRGAR